MLPYHNIDPILFSLGPLVIRWYSLSYIAGIILGWLYAGKLIEHWQSPYTKKNLDDFILWATAGIILGGRFGYVLFYNFADYLYSPWQIFAVWNGGMSFHGGMLGMIVAMYFFAKKQNESFLHFADIIACVAPIGLFFGRIANFINGELWGTKSNLPWAMPFPQAGAEPRHPSQLYEALLEGLILFFLLRFIFKRVPPLQNTGLLSGIFLAWYGFSRFLVEFVREPNKTNSGDLLIYDFFGLQFTTGQLLNFPMMMIGGYLIIRALQGRGQI